jgi:hypothetical protein
MKAEEVVDFFFPSVWPDLSIPQSPPHPTSPFEKRLLNGLPVFISNQIERKSTMNLLFATFEISQTGALLIGVSVLCAVFAAYFFYKKDTEVEQRRKNAIK